MSHPRTWFITGCSSGFGRSIAEAALLAGDSVIATARRAEDLEILAHLGAGRCLALPLDITDAKAVSEVVSEAAAFTGRLDVIVNNAGYGLLGAVEECTDDQARRNFETNFFGPLNVIRATLPVLRPQKAGHIITLSAAAAISNYPGFGIYGAAKAAVESLHESLAAELRPHGLKVTLVQPGPFRTQFISRGLEQVTGLPEYEGTAGKFAGYLKKIDGSQPGDPELAAEVIVRMVQSGQAPLRLPLGRYAVKKTRDVLAARLHELEAWELEAASADRPA